MAFTMLIFMTPPNTRTQYVEISCTEFYPNRVKIVEILAKFHARLPEKYSLRYNHFHKTQQRSKILRENLTETSAQIWKVRYEFFYAPKYNTTLNVITFTKLSTFFWCTRSVRKVSDRIFLCEHLMDYNLARLHEPILNLSAHA